MSKEPVRIDVTDSPELLRLIEEIERSGTTGVLVRDDHEIAVVTPTHTATSSRSGRSRRQPERILNIIGIGASGEPTDVAQHKDAYLAEAAEHTGA